MKWRVGHWLINLGCTRQCRRSKTISGIFYDNLDLQVHLKEHQIPRRLKHDVNDGYLIWNTKMYQTLSSQLLHDVHDVKMMMRRDHLSSRHNQIFRVFLHPVEGEDVGVAEEGVDCCICSDM